MSVDYNTRVRMHPAAIATIVDAHERRSGGIDFNSKTKTHIIGTLMGTTDGKMITVDHTFTINHESDYDEHEELINCQLDKQHQQEMLALTRASTPDQFVVGWYSTGKGDFSELDKLLFDYYSSEAQKTKGHKNPYTSFNMKKTPFVKPIFIRVNVESLRDQKKKKMHTLLPINAYLPETFNITQDEDDEVQYDLIWTELPIEIGCGAAERTALEMMMKTSLPKPDKPEYPVLRVDAVGSNLDPLQSLSKSLLKDIDRVQDYIDTALEEGELDETTGRMLSEVFTGVPGLDKETMEKTLNGELTDLLMVTFLSQLANCQIAINDKLKQAYAHTPKTAAAKHNRR